MHVILGSQTLGGAYSLARATLGKFVAGAYTQRNRWTPASPIETAVHFGTAPARPTSMSLVLMDRQQGGSATYLASTVGKASIGNADRSEELVAKLVDLARESGRIGDPVIRQSLAALEGWALAHKYSAFRQFSLAADGREPGLIGLLMKLLVTDIGHEAARIAQELIAEDALLQPAPPGVKGRGREKWLDQIIGSLGVSIAGGASNIQRNIIAERGLGLPRDATGDGT